MIFYFTATGNSLYVAKHFSDKPVSIPRVMRGTQRQFSDDAIGIVCPVYAGEPPRMVKQFLRESSFQADYVYFILTYGFDAADAPEFTARLAAEAGVRVDYIASILMADNYLPVFDMAEQMGMDKNQKDDRQRCAVIEHHDQRSDNGSNSDDHFQQTGLEHIGDFIKVTGYTAQDLTGLVLVKKAQGETVQFVGDLPA